MVKEESSCGNWLPEGFAALHEMTKKAGAALLETLPGASLQPLSLVFIVSIWGERRVAAVNLQ